MSFGLLAHELHNAPNVATLAFEALTPLPSTGWIDDGETRADECWTRIR
jgi:hypothetical protein